MSSIPQIVLPDQFNATDAFLDRNLREGGGARPALYYQNQLYPYAQVAELANRVGNDLRELGVEQEQRVALLLLDSPGPMNSKRSSKDSSRPLSTRAGSNLWPSSPKPPPARSSASNSAKVLREHACMYMGSLRVAVFLIIHYR